jgi:hypothetical protein
MCWTLILFPNICRPRGIQCKQNVSGDAYFEFAVHKGHMHHNDSVQNILRLAPVFSISTVHSFVVMLIEDCA